ncbi:phosphate signaling complex protein PhoU [Shimia haliotis]|uniref:Phosphate-specific transport system accessory protein PhoU n=1 Tax=Shimia haliotis TaxID=1280847 RepID=A0A1I4B155_9RHOB|nr:phosphate signaling complex protein PhoU [Shimia haliotis]SFK61649.1 phosphate uptake regulator, PhoU [Shimia haliotis]
MSDQHIVSAFDRDLEGIQAHVMKMGGLVEAAIVDASQSLLNQDEELSAEVIRRDQAIDDLDTLINEECANLIALRAPAALDLRMVLSVMKISGNLERIGDYAKNMAKRNTVLVQLTPIEGARGALQRMAREVQLMLKDVLDAFIERDVEKAQDVLLRDRDVDQMYNALFREFLTFMMEDPRHITPCMHLHFIAKNTERMGDHVTSIAEQTIYLVSGSMPEDNRPKATRYEPE